MTVSRRILAPVVCSLVALSAFEPARAEGILRTMLPEQRRMESNLNAGVYLLNYEFDSHLATLYRSFQLKSSGEEEAKARFISAFMFPRLRSDISP